MIGTSKTTTARARTALAVALVSGGCAKKGDIRTLQDELRAVTARQDSILTEIRAQTLQTQDTLRTQGDRMFDLRGDINRQLREINQSLTRLEAIAGENQRGLVAVRDQLANVRRLPGGAAQPILQDSAAAAAGGESLLAGGSDPDQLWRAAHEQLDRGSFVSATRAFEDFVGEYPDDPRVPDAYWFLADILAQQDRPEDALEKYREIQELYPTSARVPEALYRIAMIQKDHLGDIEAAKATLERIMNTYPDTLVAMLARDELREIG